MRWPDPDAHPPVPTDRLEALLDVGRNPLQLALKPDGGELFVSNSQSNSISEIVTTTNDVGGAYIMGDNPVHGLVSSDNSLLYVANLRSQEVTIYSIDDGKRAGSIHVGDGPSAMAFSDAGHLLFVVDARSADVAVVRTVHRGMRCSRCCRPDADRMRSRLNPSASVDSQVLSTAAKHGTVFPRKPGKCNRGS